jgi:hypothetical protein
MIASTAALPTGVDGTVGETGDEGFEEPGASAGEAGPDGVLFAGTAVGAF